MHTYTDEHSNAAPKSHLATAVKYDQHYSLLNNARCCNMVTKICGVVMTYTPSAVFSIHKQCAQ